MVEWKKDSLSLLKNYESSESGDESCTENQEERRLPLPELPSYSVAKSVSRERADSPSQHENRIRNFPHEPGNWSTFVYIPVEDCVDLSEFIESLQQYFSPIDLKVTCDFHVSLTKTVILKHHWIAGFVDSVKLSISDFNPFQLSFSGLKVYLNDNKTRTFIGLQIEQGTNNLNLITKKLDDCLLEYKLPTFYKNASFHLSILWTLGDRHYNKLNEFLVNLPQELKSFRQVINVDHLACNCGNKVFQFLFKSK